MLIFAHNNKERLYLEVGLPQASIMRKRVIWIIITALISAYGLLSWVQYEYYGRVLSLRKETMRIQMKDAMSSVAQELQVRELIRYLNRGLLRENDRFADSEFLPSSVADFDIWTRTKLDTLAVEKAIDSNRFYLKVPQQGDACRFDYRPSDWLVHAYFSDLHLLDRHILKFVYDSYARDSIPQMVNIRLLKSLIREHLDSKELCGPYQMALYDSEGNLLYEYRPPVMDMGRSWEEQNTITQHLFVPTDGTNEGRPFMKISMDIAPTKAEVMRLAFPSLVSTVIVLILGFSALGVLLKHMSFSSQRTSFINNMTHELKTPVSTILLSTRSLGQNLSGSGGMNPKVQEALSIIGLETQRMKFLIDKVLQFSLLDGESGKFPVDFLDVNELLLPVAEIYTFHAQQRGGDLILDLDAINTWVRGNSIHLSNVFFNLLDNAVKYSKPGEPLQLAIRTKDEDGMICITIEDNGIGMEKKELKRVFDRFYRVSSGNKYEVRGFGLGLAYVTSVIRQCGGTINAESTLGVGTKMIIHLPASEME